MRNYHNYLSLLFWLLGLWLTMMLINNLLLSTYKITSDSMEPTIKTGKHIIVYRLKCLWSLSPNEIICFNYPHVNENLSSIGLGKEVYCKRVLGCPGDRIGAVDGHCWNDRYLRPIGVVGEQEKLRWMFDGFFRMTHSFDVFPYSDNGWNLKNWGPIVVPAKDMNMLIDESNRELYRQVIEYETGEPLDESLKEYTFRGDYYFAVGDNAMSSFDSRYWGFIPEDFIIGIVGGKRIRNK